MSGARNEDFVGRKEHLEWLRASWEQARQGKPQLCVLRGESGFGKTRIVQAFYAWLSSNSTHDPDGYWPDTLLKEESNLRLNPPAALFGHGKELPWLWWGIRWTDPERRNQGELSACALIDALKHLEPHRESLVASKKKRALEFKVAKTIAATAADALSLGVIPAAMSIKELVDTYRAAREIDVQKSLTIEQKQANAIQEDLDALLAFLMEILRPSRIDGGLDARLPLILILDDAHWIDEGSLAILQRLLLHARENACPLFVIATHWEREWNLHGSSREANVASKFRYLYLISPDPQPRVAGFAPPAAQHGAT